MKKIVFFSFSLFVAILLAYPAFVSAQKSGKIGDRQKIAKIANQSTIVD